MLNRDLRTLYAGMAAVAAVGLIGGAYMHPTLKPLEGGPQIQAGVAGERVDHAYDYAASWTSYQGQVPEYVIGTDWLKPPQYAMVDDVPDYRDEPITVDEADYAADTGDTTQAVADSEPEPQALPREPVAYPSLGGDITRRAEPPPEDVPTAG